MPVLDIDAIQLEQLVAHNSLVFVDFWANWCPPCKQFLRTYEKIADQYSSIVFTKVNVEEQGALSETLEIRSIPHLIIFKNKIIVYSESGSMPESAFKELVEQSISLKL